MGSENLNVGFKLFHNRNDFIGGSIGTPGDREFVSSLQKGASFYPRRGKKRQQIVGLGEKIYSKDEITTYMYM
jgi:hypothetical protein